MALYEYECRDCQHHEDFQIPMTEEKSPRECPKCKGTMVRLIVDMPADHYRDKFGRYQRAPGKAWVGPDEFDEQVFHKLNDVNSNRHRYAKKKDAK